LCTTARGCRTSWGRGTNLQALIIRGGNGKRALVFERKMKWEEKCCRKFCVNTVILGGGKVRRCKGGKKKKQDQRKLVSQKYGGSEEGGSDGGGGVLFAVWEKLETLVFKRLKMRELLRGGKGTSHRRLGEERST